MHGRPVASFMLQGFDLLPFRERVKTRLKWSERDEADPEKVRQTMIKVVMVLEKKQI